MSAKGSRSAALELPDHTQLPDKDGAIVHTAQTSFVGISRGSG